MSLIYLEDVYLMLFPLLSLFLHVLDHTFAFSPLLDDNLTS